MKKVYINGSSLCGSITGIERYVYEILKRLDHLVTHTSLSLYVLYPKGNSDYIPAFNNITCIPLPACGCKLSVGTLKKFLKNNKGIYCSLAGNFCFQKETIMCIHDIRPLLYSCYDTFFFRLRCRINFLSARLFAQRIVTVSNTSREAIIQNLKIQHDKITVIYNGWEHMNNIDEDEKILNRYPLLLNSDYFYSLGSLAPHKNLKWVVQTAINNPESLFVVAGKQMGSIFEFVPKNMLILGYITDEENKALMRHCKAFIHPSKYEGFGIPPLEALSCGAHVCVARTSCLPELYEGYVCFFNPDDYHIDLSELLKNSVSDPGPLLEKYSWDKAAQQWIDIFLEEANH